ncbi:MAG TPA: phosphatidylserine/phosphatidylglycerophosphate/cardiolipin synthase family protein [Thermomicrobiales bacterium]|nr:phosphatidylserine/phosphatidylglycerophosphate/cardiolipin synthase family protein [Thermomicrobiales bacterium]
MTGMPSPQLLAAIEVALAEAALTKPHPEIQPDLTITPSNDVKTVAAAVSPESSYRLVKETVDAAREDLRLYIYHVEADYLIELLRDAEARGVRVRIMCEASQNNEDEQQRLRDLGAEVKTAPSTRDRPAFSLCHQKFAVIDGKTLLLGSANWGDNGVPLLTEPGAFFPGYREWFVRIDNESLADWFTGLFDADWDVPVQEVPPGVVEEALARAPVLVPVVAGAVPEKLFDIQRVELDEPVRVTPIISPDNYLTRTKQLIEEATSSIDIQQQYIKFRVADTPQLGELLAALERRKDELTIRILLSARFPESWEDSLASLAQFNLIDRVKAMNSEFFAHLHNKGLIFDRRKVIVTSTNWSQNSIALAREAGVLIESPEIAEYYAEVFDFDWEIARNPSDVRLDIENLMALAAADTVQYVPVHPADIA